MVQKTHWLVWILCWIAVQANAQQINCIDVAANGNVILSWDGYSGPDYSSYRILDQNNAELFTSNSEGDESATLIGYPVGIATEFRLVVDLSDGSSVIGAAVEPMIITVVTGESEDIKVAWESGLAGGSDVTVMRTRESGLTESLVTISGNTASFTDDLKVCHEELTYQLTYDNGSCLSSSNSVTSTINDEQAPDAPDITSVGIDPWSDSLRLNWQSSIADDVKGYIIFQSEAPGALQKTVVDTVLGASTTDFSAWITGAWNDQFTYSIAAFDTCRFVRPIIGNSYGVGPTNEEHTVILLNPLNYSPADRSVVLSWESYAGWPVDNYEIWQSLDGGVTETMVGSVNSGTRTFVVDDLVINQEYHFYIRGKEVGGITTTTSNGVTGIITVTGIPEVINLNSVSIESGTQIAVDVTTDVSPGTTYQLFRSVSPTSVFSVVQTTTSQDGFQVLFQPDQPGGVNVNTYYYQVCAVDNWGGITTCSNVQGTYTGLVAEVNNATYLTSLSWPVNANWDSLDFEVVGVNIYRSDGRGFGELLTTLGPDELAFEDDLSEIEQSSGTFCYVIEFQIENDDRSFASKSTEKCVTLEPRVWVANAFVVDGNAGLAEFSPVSIFLPSTHYLFLIYNRWGNLVFKSDDPDVGWDGNAASDVYTWKLQYSSGQEELHTKTGTVTLIR